MGNTVNNNWPYPESSDLVKDGATAIENLADAIDTTLGVYTPATPGLVLIGSPVTFSGVSSQVLTNVFSATYDNYRLIIDLTTVSASQEITLRLRTSGGSDATTNYTNAVRTFSDGGASGNLISTTSWKVMLTRSGSPGHFYSLDMNLHSPFLATATTHTMTGISRNSAGASLGTYGGGMHEDSTSFSSLSILVDTGNVTGKAYIYGYNI
jgi:hypothetical protein